MSETTTHIDKQNAKPSQSPTATAPVIRQFVNFMCLKVDPAWRRLSESDRSKGKTEFIKAVEDHRSKLMILTYSNFGYRPETDFMIWRIGLAMEDFENMSAALHKTLLGAYLSTPHSFLSMTKRSMYVDKINPEHIGQRTRIVPGKHKYLFVYPFVKSREWYLLPIAERQKMMDAHIKVGQQFPSVKLNTSYSFGLDDQDFVVAFETDKPADFVDLVMALRETDGSRYTVRDTPIITCIHRPLNEILDIVA